MEVGYYAGNRERLYKKLCPGELLAIFSGEDVWKTGDECYPFFTERNFVYLTGLRCNSAVLLAIKDADSSVQERLYILPPDAHADEISGLGQSRTDNWRFIACDTISAARATSNTSSKPIWSSPASTRSMLGRFLNCPYSVGAGSAILYGKLFIADKGSVSATFA